jgi:leucyl/phenylalanyl-tRNA--protein transferase
LPYFEISEQTPEFPPAYFADSDGLVAVGGDLTPDRLLQAYAAGIYFWHHPMKRIQWWSPDPRLVIRIKDFEPSADFHELQKLYSYKWNNDLSAVLAFCKQVHNGNGHWTHASVTGRMARCYEALHQRGFLKSAAVYRENILVAGIIGVALGRMFFGEYLVSSESEANRFAMLSLLETLKSENFEIIDLQKESMALEGIIPDEMSRLEFVNLCKEKTKN